MKKSLFILTLALLQCACASQVATRHAANSMLGFDEIGAEISVSFEKTDATDDLSQAVALNDIE